MRAKDVMHKRVLTVTEEVTLKEVARLFTEHRISGAPVIDGRKHLLGVISQTDIVRKETESRPKSEVPSYYRVYDQNKDYASGFEIEDPDFTKVKDVMTPVVLSADEDTPVEEIAEAMLQKHIHRVIITRGRKLAGIVTTMDVLRGFLEQGKSPAYSARRREKEAVKQ